MRSVMSADRTNGQAGLFEIEDQGGRKVYASVVIGLSKTFTPKGYDQIASFSGSAVSLDIPEGAETAIIIAEGAGFRWRDDDVDPTAGVGMPVWMGQELNYDGDLSLLRIIGMSSASIANLTFYGP